MGRTELECPGARVLRQAGCNAPGGVADAPLGWGNAVAHRTLRVTRQMSVRLGTIALEWTRIGITGFGGPPTHIALLRQLVVRRRRWLDEREFQDAVAACNLLPGPA